MRDFTIDKYNQLLDSLIKQKYTFQTFNEYIIDPAKRSIILRHDVDDRPNNSLVLAKIENSLGLKGVYNFRAVPHSWDESIIREISDLGHEIGYHYENLTTCGGNYEASINDFKLNLNKLRKLVPVTTITMHGSPKSKYDSRDLWKNYNYKDLGLIGEPYFDINFDKVLYLTDTGRMWDGYKVNIRDKVKSFKNMNLQNKNYKFHSTDNIITAAQKKELPDVIMFTIHPQRWHINNKLWLKELILQNAKNIVKRLIVIINSKKPSP